MSNQLDISDSSDNDTMTCYVCQSPESDMNTLIKPCDNPKCTGRLHITCATEQLIHNSNNSNNNSNAKKCGNCQNPITIKTKKKFNSTRCCSQLLKSIFTVVMILIGTFSPIIIALGTTITHWIDCESTKIKPCDTGGVGVVFYSLPFAFAFWQFPQCCCCKYNIFCWFPSKDKIRWKSYLTMIIISIISNCLVAFAHVIGNPIVKSMFNMDVPFTWRTSLAGFIVYTLGLAFVLLILAIYNISHCIINCVEEQFSETILDLDTIDDTLIDMQIEMIDD